MQPVGLHKTVVPEVCSVSRSGVPPFGVRFDSPQVIFLRVSALRQHVLRMFVFHLFKE
jgi:hypothetical protein